MDVITLASQPFKVAAITRKTRAELFKDAAVGDILRFSLAMTAPGQRARGGQFATCIRVDNETQVLTPFFVLNLPLSINQVIIVIWPNLSIEEYV